jgi:hypothetical protein
MKLNSAKDKGTSLSVQPSPVSDTHTKEQDEQEQDDIFASIAHPNGTVAPTVHGQPATTPPDKDTVIREVSTVGLLPSVAY